MTVEIHFDAELKKLKNDMVSMGDLVQLAIEKAILGLRERHIDYLNEVHLMEKAINRYHIRIDESCVRTLALHSPLASNLRLVVAIIKMNTDLERMGDQAVNIAHNAKHYINEPSLKPLVDIPRMAEEVRIMVRDTMDAFLKEDVKLAREVMSRDDSVDRWKTHVFKELIGFMEIDPNTVRRAINLILIARNLERLGDHATNIAEDVIYVITGDDVRHASSKG